jgi:hypothetical protein
MWSSEQPHTAKKTARLRHLELGGTATGTRRSCGDERAIDRDSWDAQGYVWWDAYPRYQAYLGLEAGSRKSKGRSYIATAIVTAHI